MSVWLRWLVVGSDDLVLLWWRPEQTLIKSSTGDKFSFGLLTSRNMFNKSKLVYGIWWG